MYIYNLIVENLDVIRIKDFADDPLALTIEELGCKPISANLDSEILFSRINLRLSDQVKLLERSSSIVRCGDCFAPVTNFMIP